jgi:glycosyltransferase involved in cell wall biosynthesis
MKQHTRHYIAVSEAVKTNLVENHAIAAGDVNVIYGFTDVKSCTQLDPEQSRYRIRSALGIPRDAIVVGGAGGVGWHKGVDLFVQLAALINRRKIGNQVFFLWVGGPTQGRSFVETWSDVQRADVERVVKFTGFQPNPLEHFAAMDILALTSREDSFPLVVLEAAALGVPAVCFDRAGGACEFVSPDCGFVVPYLDVDAFAHKVWSLLEVPELRKEMGERARQKVQENHDITVIAPKLLKVIERYYGS